ncbi:MAG: EF-Tu/IF-2/RF-3 family GTPase [Candidatus Bathyarchaeota archaeon]
MTNLNVAVLGCPGYSRELGKKGTESDITLYNMKKGETTVTIVETSKYPEKLQSLFYAAGFGDFIILVVDEINASFGETVLMLDCLGKKEGIIIPRNYITKEQLSRFINGTVVEGYEVIEENLPLLREFIMGKAEALVKGDDSPTGGVVVDHHFNVKGIGIVALGVVRWGQIHRHDKLRAYPTEKIAQLRSIQRHDTDFETAEAGNRVGLALKNIEPSDIDRGTLLSNDESVKQTTLIEGKLDLVKYWTKPVEKGMTIHIGKDMQFIAGAVEDSAEETIRVNIQKPLTYRDGENATMLYLNGGNLRVVGSIKL